jgi:hypothetical protein
MVIQETDKAVLKFNGSEYYVWSKVLEEGEVFNAGHSDITGVPRSNITGSMRLLALNL